MPFVPGDIVSTTRWAIPISRLTGSRAQTRGLRTAPLRCLSGTVPFVQIGSLISPSALALPAGGWLRPRTADVHHIAIALGCIRIDKSRYQQPIINGDDFAILFSASGPWRDQYSFSRPDCP